MEKVSGSFVKVIFDSIIAIIFQEMRELPISLFKNKSNKQ